MVDDMIAPIIANQSPANSPLSGFRQFPTLNPLLALPVSDLIPDETLQFESKLELNANHQPVIDLEQDHIDPTITELKSQLKNAMDDQHFLLAHDLKQRIIAREDQLRQEDVHRISTNTKPEAIKANNNFTDISIGSPLPQMGDGDDLLLLSTYFTPLEPEKRKKKKKKKVDSSSTVSWKDEVI